MPQINNNNNKKSICGFFITLCKPGMFHQRIHPMTWKKGNWKSKKSGPNELYFWMFPSKNVFQVHGNTFWWFEFAHPVHILVMTHSSLILARELRYLLSTHARMKNLLLVWNYILLFWIVFFRKKNLVWNTSILPLDVQSTIGLWKDSNFSPILSASWIVFY